MYRSKYQTPKSSQDIRFWGCSSKLRQSGFRNSVHALAYVNPEAYDFIVDSLLSGISLELIMSELHRHYSDCLLQMQANGFGSLSPNSLLTFRRELENNNVVDLDEELKHKPIQLNRLIKYAKIVDALIQKVSDIEKRSGILTRLGYDLVKLGFTINLEILKLQQQLALAN